MPVRARKEKTKSVLPKRTRPPYTLPSNIVYFHDWRYVDTGSWKWVDSQGQPLPLWSPDPLPPDLRLEHGDRPKGIRLVAQPARKTEPFLTPYDSSEILLYAGTIIHDEGRYRLWYDCWPKESEISRMGNFNILRYAESDDGVDWKFPKLGLIEYQGSRDNNIVYGATVVPGSGYNAGCIFKDPSAPADERYKIFYQGSISQEQLARYRSRRPDAVDPFWDETTDTEMIPAVFGGTSPDGLRWKSLPEPLLVQYCDTANVCTYDVARGTYVAYVRSRSFNRRSISRTETDDFQSFPLSEDVFYPDATCAPYNLWYANAKTVMPGSSDYHVMFPLRWNMFDDSWDFYLATSPDDVIWGFVPGGAVCKPGEPGAWDAGVVALGVGLVRLPEKRMGIPFAGTPLPHKHPRRPPLGAIAWAWWPEGRLVALEAAEEGSFALFPLHFQGRTVHLNFRTAVAGYVQVEALDGDGKPLPGREFADCGHLCGDQLDRVVTWRGQSDLGHTEGSPVKLRFRLRSAELFSVEFK